MIRSAYLAPTEEPVSLIDVKRALLTFDRVCIADPNDRDLIPPQSFMLALGMPPIFGFNMGAVRPLGKFDDYDNAFDRLMDRLQIARRQGVIDVVSTYDLATSSQGTIGAVLMGDYPLNPRFMLWAYRAVAREPEVLTAAIAGDKRLMSLSEDNFESLSITGSSADGAINDDPELPLLDGEFSREWLRRLLTCIARARVASTMKSIGFCASKDLVPVFGNSNFDALVGLFAARATQVIDRVAEEDPYWQTRNRVFNIAHSEYINDEILSEMPIDEVLKLRSKAWGEQAKARDELLHAVAELAREAINENDFDQVVRDKIRAYRTVAEDVKRQRSMLSFSINCELIKGAGGVAAPIMAGTVADGFLSQMQTAIGAGTVLLAGCLWAVSRVQELKPLSEQLRSVETEFQDNVCFGLHNFYRGLANGVGGDFA